MPTHEIMALPVSRGRKIGRVQNRYRISCGHFVDCGCRHVIGALVWCPKCSKRGYVTRSAIRQADGRIVDRSE